MVKRAGGALLRSLSFDAVSGRSLTSQIASSIRDIVLAGGLQAGERLPSTRTLARELGVSRTTVVEVFERLTAEGLVESRVGAGTYVSHAISAKRSGALPAVGPKPVAGWVAAQRRKRGSPRDNAGSVSSSSTVFADRLPHEVRAFTTALPAFDEFPVALWARQTAKHWREQRDVILGYGAACGYPPLRRAIAGHLRASQGIMCDERQIFVVNGAQQAFHVIASVLLDEGDVAWFENPGAIGARNALVACGARLVPVPIDQEGLVVADALQRAPQFKLAFVTPTHQQPLGVTMSLVRRFALLEAAEDAGAWIIEDDYDGEFYYGRHPVPALKSIDQSGRVLYVGTFSKTLFPALRLGYFLAPTELVEQFEKVFEASLPGVPSNPQAVVANFIDEGHFATHVRRMRRIYTERYQVFLEWSHRYLGGLLDVQPTDSGLHTISFLPSELPEDEVAQRAEERDITVAPIGRFCLAPVELNGLALGFSGINPHHIRAGIETLASLLEEMYEMRSPDKSVRSR